MNNKLCGNINKILTLGGKFTGPSYTFPVIYN